MDWDFDSLKEDLEAFRGMSFGELRELQRPLSEELTQQVRDLRNAFRNLPSERGEAINPTTHKRHLSNKQAWADALCLVFWLERPF